MLKLRTLAAVVLTACLLSAVGCSQAPNSNGSNSTGAIVANQVKLKVPGMTWGIACVALVKETLEPLPGVANVNVDFDSRVATVNLDGDFDVKNSLAKLASAGYDKATVISQPN